MKRDKTNLNIYDIRDILREDQTLFDKTIQKLKQRTFLIELNTAQPRRLPNKRIMSCPGQRLSNANPVPSLHQLITQYANAPEH